MKQVYIDLLYALISAGIPCIVGSIFAGLKHFIGTQNAAKITSLLQSKSHIASEAVLFAEDAYKELGGPQKYDNAKLNLVQRLNTWRVPITADEADTLISAAYQTLKASLNENVGRITS